MAAMLVVVLAGCTQAQLRGYLPGEPGITNHTDRVAGLWTTSWIILLLVGLVTWGLIIWVAVVYRRRKGQTGLPVQLRYNMPIETFFTVVPAFLLLGRRQLRSRYSPGGVVSADWCLVRSASRSWWTACAARPSSAGAAR